MKRALLSLVLLVPLLPACNGGKGGAVELDCTNAADDDADGLTDCDDPDCGSTLACGNDTDTDTSDTDTDGDTDTDVPLPYESLVDVYDAKITGERAEDRSAFAIAGGTDVSGDGKDDILIGAYSHQEGDLTAGAAYVVDGAPSGVVGLASASAKLVGDEDQEELGYSVAMPGDVTGDGQADLLIGADRGNNNKGLALVIPGPVSGTIDIGTAYELRGQQEDDHAGFWVSGAGDVNGDGNADLLVGADRSDEHGTDSGTAYLVLGPLTDDVVLKDITSSEGARYTGEAINDWAGHAVSGAGDVDGDGLDDVLVGAFQHDNGGDADAGAAYLIYSPTLGLVQLSSADAYFPGKRPYDLAGGSLAPIGDENGDGYPDFAIGAYGSSDNGSQSGSVYVFDGGATRYADEVAITSGVAQLHGGSAYDRAGHSIAGPGDLNGDGNDDLVVGSFGYDDVYTERGAVYVVYGPVAGDNDLIDVKDEMYAGEQANDGAGHRVAGAGDTNGDGHPDFLIGAYEEATGGPEAGATYLILGGS